MIWISWIAASEAPNWKALMDQRLNMFGYAVEFIALQTRSDNNVALGQKCSRFTQAEWFGKVPEAYRQIFLTVLEAHPEKTHIHDWASNWEQELERLKIVDCYPHKTLQDWCDELERFISVQSQQ